MKTKTRNPIRIPTSAGTCWVVAHQHLIASYIEWDDFLFIILHSGHHLLGYTSEAGWLTYEDEEGYPEYRTAQFWGEALVGYEEWAEAIRDIPALYAEYDPR